ncbi:MAG: type II toxin-antitoxin system PemK/MazF family toxin [Chlorogloeopsis fritschii C42_A2020_084]|uniref:type II toxin-antitoxin system PemK/MazF family toxin n=1 Tax=Chlorogloeopsis fritschii TaxID=1124 RepID=UPI0019DE6C3F|nr:type II toxin-antitoxin system PemK/MazF family toxin [Chlorogloeopsis fritschii]MBF2007407.1 type II toxin-antitoxin system PemK/MazF family toxin [Chlorogloeopsis fritschii C42_A2020_084]
MLQPDLLACGDVVIVALPKHTPRGREQQGTRPGIVVGIPSEEVRYPMIIIAPLTTQSGSWALNNPSLYPRLEVGAGGLSQSSIVLLDQIRGLDLNRVVAYLGTLNPNQYALILNGIMQLFGQQKS